MLKAYKYRIYPTAEQADLINQSIGACRLIYNLALETKINTWQSVRKSLSAIDLINQLPELKEAYPWMKEVDSQALQCAIWNMDTAFQNFFKGAGFPKFKSKHKSKLSFQCPNNTRRVDWNKNTITIPKIANIPTIFDRRFKGQIKTIAISKTPTGKYYASILVDDKAVLPAKPIVKCENAIGIDLGISTFAAISTGENVNNPRHLKKNIDRLKVLQRRASRKQKGSSNRKKANLRVSCLHESIANQRNDFLHKLSTRLIRDNQTDTICIETLAVKNMIKNHSLAQAISDVSWSEFVRQLEYKGEWYGKNIVKVDRWFASSKTCSCCGYLLDEMDLSVRKWICPECNADHDRDVNAAVNTRNEGLRISGAGSSVEPVESRRLRRAKKQENVSGGNITNDI